MVAPRKTFEDSKKEFISPSADTHSMVTAICCVHATLFVLRSDSYDDGSGRQRSEKVPECIPLEHCGCCLSIDHDNGSGVGRSHNFKNVSVLNQ